MKKFFTFLVLVQSLISCSKKDVAVPDAPSQELAIAYADANISVKDFKAVETAKNTVNIVFSTMYENNIKKIDVMSGTNENQLCSIYNIQRSTNSTQTLSYSVFDPKPKASTTFYMIRYTLQNGDWGYTPIYKLQVN